MLLYLRSTGGNFLTNKTGLGLLLSKKYCIYFIIEFYLFVYSGVSCCKFWYLEHARRDILDMTIQRLQVCWEDGRIAC